MSYQQPPYARPPSMPPRKRRTWLWVTLGTIGALFAGCVAIGIAAVSSVDTSTDSDASAPTDEAAAGEPTAGEEAKPKPAGIGMPVRDGNFEFVVEQVKCGVKQVGSQYLNEKAQGQFCLVSMTVKNVKDESRTFDASSQYAYDADGRKFDADGTASIYANENHQTFLEVINPGNSVSGVVVFDVPANVKLAELELHDSPFSGGVKVAV
jgi:Domain of unknown function (DUF4352)